MPVYFVNTSHPGSKSLGGATFKLDVGRATDSSLGDFDFTAKTATPTMPVFVYAAEILFGNMDRVVLESPPAGKATRLLVSDCGHLPWIECPDRFVPAIRSFLQ